MPSDRALLSQQVAQLCTQLVAGDSSALGELFDLTAARLVRYGEVLSRCRAEAEDALQSMMVKLARTPQRLAQADQPWAYCVKMYRNELLKSAEVRSRHSRAMDVLRTWMTRPRWTIPCEEDWREQVQAAVKRLPPEQGEVIVLKIWEGLTF